MNDQCIYDSITIDMLYLKSMHGSERNFILSLDFNSRVGERHDFVVNENIQLHLLEYRLIDSLVV